MRIGSKTTKTPKNKSKILPIKKNMLARDDRIWGQTRTMPAGHGGAEGKRCAQSVDERGGSNAN